MKHLDMFKSRGVALVASAVILALAAGGGAVAGSKITSADIKDHAVTKADLHKNAVVSKTVKNGKLKMKDLDKPTQDAIKKGVGPAGPQGPAGPPGTSGTDSAARHTETGVASVYVDRGSGPTRYAIVSAALGPMATTTSGHFRFSCSAAQAPPCEVSIGAAVISPEARDDQGVPEAHDPQAGRRGAARAMTYCEYADGARNRRGLRRGLEGGHRSGGCRRDARPARQHGNRGFARLRRGSDTPQVARRRRSGCQPGPRPSPTTTTCG